MHARRSIGVSNFNVHHLEELKKVRPHSLPVGKCGHVECILQRDQNIFADTVNRVLLSVNQIELSPFLARTELTSYCQKEGVVVTAYSPLTKGHKLNDPKLMAIASR